VRAVAKTSTAIAATAMERRRERNLRGERATVRELVT
jgi:hypothetical protein